MKTFSANFADLTIILLAENSDTTIRLFFFFLTPKQTFYDFPILNYRGIQSKIIFQNIIFFR